MTHAPTYEMLTCDEIRSIHSATLKLLEEVGVIIRAEEALHLLADEGASVDLNRSKARIPPSLVEDAITKKPRNLMLYSRDRKHDVDLAQTRTYVHPTGGTMFVSDFETGESRPATLSDLEFMAKIVDALENIQVGAMAFFPNDAAAEIRDIHSAERMLRFCSKHLLVAPYNSVNLGYMVRLAIAIAGSVEKLGKEPLISVVVSPDSPLQYSEEVATMLIESAKLGLPISILPTPLAGGTSPVTLAGTLVQLNAEILAGNLLAQLTNPGTTVTYSPRPTPMDMVVGSASYGAVEYGMMSAATVQLAKFYGMPSDVGGFGTNSKLMDEQAAFERALNGLLPAMAGANLLDGAGLLEADMASSPEQAVIDDEISGMIQRVRVGIAVENETLALDAIRRIGPGGHFLKDAHTRKYLRREHFIPKLCDRNARLAWQMRGGKSINAVAKERASELLRHHEPAQLDKYVIAEMERILDEARKDLVM